MTTKDQRILVTRGHEISGKMKRLISEGVYPPASRLPAERELCEQFGVSRPPIRSALAILERDGLIKRFPRRGTIVTEKAEDLTDTTLGTHTILFAQYCSDMNVAPMVAGILRLAAERDEEALVIDARGSHERIVEVIRHPPRGIKGALVVPIDHEIYEQAIKQACEVGLKVVMLDRVLPSVEVSSLTVDNFRGSFEATDHLIHIHGMPAYYLGTKDQPSSSHDRYCGWLTAMRKHGFRDWQDYFLRLKMPEYESSQHLDIALDEAHLACKSLFQEKREERYSVVAMNDSFAEGVYSAAEEAGLAIGKGVFVCGFDDLPLCQRLDPPLSSVSQSLERVGLEGARLLYEELDNKTSRPVHKVLPVKLVIRASSTGI